MIKSDQLKVSKLTFPLVFLLWFWGNAFGNDDIIVRALVDKARAPSDETVLYTIKVEYSKGSQISIPDMGPYIEGFEIEDFGSKGPTFEDGRLIEERWYRLEAPISGTYVLPEVIVPFKLSDGSTGEKKVAEIFVEIIPPGDHSSKDDLNLDIKDITPVKDYRLYFLLGIIAGVLVVGGTIFIYVNKRSKRKKIVPPVPVHIWSLEQLEKVKSKFEGPEEGSIRPLYFELSDVIRIYFEKTFSFPATDRTVEEIQSSLNSISNLDEKKKRLFLSILEQSDLVKFANAKAQKGEGKDLVDQSVQFIKETMPKDQEESQDQKESFL